MADTLLQATTCVGVHAAALALVFAQFVLVWFGFWGQGSKDALYPPIGLLMRSRVPPMVPVMVAVAALHVFCLVLGNSIR